MRVRCNLCGSTIELFWLRNVSESKDMGKEVIINDLKIMQKLIEVSLPAYIPSFNFISRSVKSRSQRSLISARKTALKNDDSGSQHRISLAPFILKYIFNATLFKDIHATQICSIFLFFFICPRILRIVTMKRAFLWSLIKIKSLG